MDNKENETNFEDLIISDDFKEALKELDYMEKHPEEHKRFDNIQELIKDLENDD